MQPNFTSNSIDFSSLTGRNQDAIRKTTAGLLKLIFPHATSEELKDEELSMGLKLATECRARVVDQLAILAPGEFKPAQFQLGRNGRRANWATLARATSRRWCWHAVKQDVASRSRIGSTLLARPRQHML